MTGHKSKHAAASPRFIAQRIAWMLACFPNGGPSTIPSAEIYARALIEAVIEHDPSPAVLEAACRHIVRTSIFFPTIAEVLRAVREQERLMEG